ncbi:MAG: nucleotidyltransferase [Alphaproteobacteria bacterium]|nr:nucleotidyltransferase [Alphaproteobacteria bacterium]
MKVTDLFTEFLKDTVNLNKTRLDLLEDSVGAIKDFIRQSEWTPKIKSFEEQGSWAHKTIIKPVEGQEFDADLLVIVDPVDGWTASDYVRQLGKIFSDSLTYKDKVKTWDCCVTISYAGDRKIDIAPCVKERLFDGTLEVCNRSTNAFTTTEPVLFTEWMKERNNYSGSNSFRKVTRLLKYVRDIKGTFTCSSILLTTLLGYRIDWIDKDTAEFADTPTALRTLMARLDNWLQSRPYRPTVSNPKLPSEDFAEGWTQSQYSNFRDFINKYRKWIDEAYECDDRTTSIKLWRRVFGEDFAKGEEVKIAKVADDGFALLRASLLVSTAAHDDRLVDAVRDYGLSVLPANFYTPPHMKAPPWRREPNVTARVRVVASWHLNRQSSGQSVRDGEILSRRGGLWFEVRINDFENVPYGYRVEWRITNTGSEALGLRQGRGDFYVSDTSNRRWESLYYRGVHLAEAFIVRTSDNVLVGQSAPFRVVIE